MDTTWLLLAMVPLAVCAAYGLILTGIVVVIVRATARLQPRARILWRVVALPLAILALLAVTIVVAPRVLPVPHLD